jgi:hypothetical protein
MTIKQFVSLGVGIVLAVIFYSSPLPFFFKYPLAFTFLLMGVGMAFVPVQGRSLDAWLVAFIRSIYSPTQYVWKQTALENISSDTAAPTNAANKQTAPQVSNPHMEISKGTVAINTVTPPATSITTPQPEITAPEAKPVEVVTPPIQVSAPDPQPIAETPIVTPPATEPVITPSVQEIVPPIVTEPTPTPINPVLPPTNVSPIPASPPGASQLPVPYTPTTPNTLVGLTITPDSRILDGVLVEIQKNGLTSRATKSNKLGQFMFARPLEDGLYQIFAEK